MSECTSDMQLKHTELLATMANEIKNMKYTLTDLGMIKDTLIELKILNTQTMEFNKRQIESNGEFEKTLVSINENLNSLNSRVGNLESLDVKEETTKTELRVEATRLSAEQYKSKFTFYGVIVTSVFSGIALLVAWLSK